MNYNNIPEIQNNKFMHLDNWEKIDYIIDSAYVVFLDGKNATKYHNYDMISEKGFSYNLMEATKKVLNNFNIEYHLFAIMDEITIVFPNGLALKECFEDEYEDYILTLLNLYIYKEFSKYKDCPLKALMYRFDFNDLEELFKSRKVYGKYTALEYFIKEKLGKGNYKNNTPDDIIDELKKHNLYNEYLSLTHFYNGFEYHHVRSNDSWIDSLIEVDFN